MIGSSGGARPGKISGLQGSVVRFLRCEDGSPTIEFMIWLPILLLVVSLTVDASLLLGAKANVLRVIQDANRAASIGRFKDEDDLLVAVEEYVRVNIGNYAEDAIITSEVSVAGVISTTVQIPSNSLMAAGFLGALTGLTVNINAQHMLEA